MERPATDNSKGIPESPAAWEWREYADYLEAENKRLRKVVEAAEKMITGGYADSFSNWVCPSEYAFPLEQALAEEEK